MSRLERTIYLVAGSLLAVACLFLLFRSSRTLSERAAVEAAVQVQLSKSQARVLEMEMEMADLKGQLLAARAGNGSGPLALLTDGDLAALKAAGLQAPVADLVSSLEKRPDLIPLPDHRFDSPKGWVITRRWVIARFTDGYRGGSLLLRYEVKEGQVEWSLLESLPD